jgi:uncharacterized protein YlxW (UPF0749 family)
MSEFRKGLAEFRAAMHEEGERSRVPSLQEILERRQPAPVLQFRWAVAAMVALTLGAVPVYRDTQQRQREADQERADVLLMDKVNAALSRPVPRALAALMGN